MTIMIRTPRKWLVLAAFACASMALATEENQEYNPYKTDFCMCNLDSHLQMVIMKLEKSEDPPATPNPFGFTTTTTTEPPTTTTEAPTTPAVSKRKKRSAEAEPLLSNSTGEFRDHSLGVMEPTGRMANFDGDIKVSDEIGVIYDEDYVPKRCDCNLDGSKITVGICIINEDYSTNFTSSISASSRVLIGYILPWLDNVFMKSFKSSNNYVRVLPAELTAMGKHVQANFIVEFKEKLFLAEYQVKNALEPALKPMTYGEKKFVHEYITNKDIIGCVTTEDITEAEPRVPTAFDFIRYLFIPVALGVVVLLGFYLCFGKRDKFYVRFW